MHSILLHSHSGLRWLLLALLMILVFKSLLGWLGGKSVTKSDRIIRAITVGITHLQLILGLVLYFVSPVIEVFLNDFPNSMSVKDLRFFGLEHSLLMIICTILITIGSSKSKKKTGAKAHKTVFIWMGISLLIIFVMIPWSFLPFNPVR